MNTHVIAPASAVVDVGYRRLGQDAVLRARSSWSGAQALASAVAILLFAAVATGLTFISPIERAAIFLFLGLSNFLAAVRGYPGCEILAVPNIVLRRRDAIWCPIHSSLDRVLAQRSAERDLHREGDAGTTDIGG